MVAAAVQLFGDAHDQALQDIAAYVYDLYYIVPIGYPIFYHGLVEGLNWTPRMDGFILLKEMTSRPDIPLTKTRAAVRGSAPPHGCAL